MKQDESLWQRRGNQSNGREMQRKEKLGGKREGKWWKSVVFRRRWRQRQITSGTMSQEDIQQRSWGESSYKNMVGWSQQVSVEGAGITEETLAFSMEPRPMLKMPSGAHSF